MEDKMHALTDCANYMFSFPASPTPTITVTLDGLKNLTANGARQRETNYSLPTGILFKDISAAVCLTLLLGWLW